jgi:hypothetical protein
MAGTFIDIGRALSWPSGGEVIVARGDGRWTDRFVSHFIALKCPEMPFTIGVSLLKDIAARKYGGSQFTKYPSEVSAYFVLLLEQLKQIHTQCMGLVTFGDLYRYWQDCLNLYGFWERVEFIAMHARLLFDAASGSSAAKQDIVYDPNLGDNTLVPSQSSGSSGFGDIKLFGGFVLGLAVLILIIR